jgi:hypothetical protein
VPARYRAWDQHPNSFQANVSDNGRLAGEVNALDDLGAASTATNAIERDSAYSSPAGGNAGVWQRTGLLLTMVLPVAHSKTALPSQ